MDIKKEDAEELIRILIDMMGPKKNQKFIEEIENISVKKRGEILTVFIIFEKEIQELLISFYQIRKELRI